MSKVLVLMHVAVWALPVTTVAQTMTLKTVVSDRQVLRADIANTHSFTPAQETSPFEQLPQIVKKGDSITVTDAVGQQTTGKIADLSRSSISLLVSGVRRDFAEGSVSEIRHRQRDSLVNGALWGLLVGAGVGFGISQAYLCSGCSWDPPSVPLGFAALFGGIGAGAGVGVDAVIREQKLIYSRTPTPRSVTVKPHLGRDRSEIAMSIAF